MSDILTLSCLAYRVQDGTNGPKLEYNDGAWDEFANVMFVDNPVGTGFSFVDTDSYLHELPDMANQFVQFLEKWFALFPEYEHDDVSAADGRFLPRSLTICSFILRESRMLANIFHTLQRRFWTEIRLEQSMHGN